MTVLARVFFFLGDAVVSEAEVQRKVFEFNLKHGGTAGNKVW